MGKETYLGELEQMVLWAVLRLGGDGYGAVVLKELNDRVGRRVSTGALYATLDRLEEKGCVRRTRGERINVYAAAVGREEMVGRRLRETADQLCDGSMTPLLTHLVGASDLSAEEVEALRELVERLDREPDAEGSR